MSTPILPSHKKALRHAQPGDTAQAIDTLARMAKGIAVMDYPPFVKSDAQLAAPVAPLPQDDTEGRTYTEELITPEIAAQYLTKNTRNRPMSLRNLNRIIKALQRGDWVMNGEGISFDTDDVLIDGQHTLTAIVRTGITVRKLVVRGLAPEVFPFIDNTDARDNADAIYQIEPKYPMQIAASLKSVDRYMTGRVLSATDYSNSEVLELHAKYPGMVDSVAFTSNAKKLIPHSVLAACHYLFAMKDREAANRFVQDLQRGTNLVDGDGLHALREKLMQNYMSKSKLPAVHLFALTIKAWNGRRKNKVIRNLRFGREGERPEEFPVVV